MEFNAEDFKHLRYNPYGLKEGASILENFPELARHEEYAAKIELDQNKVLKYIIYAYDRRTPLLVEKNLIRRKMDACKLAGFKLEGKKYPDNVEAMIKGENAVINKMICCFVRSQKNAHYALMVAGLENFYDNIGKLSEPSKSSDMDELNRKAKLYEQTVKMISSLESNADEIFNGDVQLMYEADEIDGEENGRIKSFPEHIATLREEGSLDKMLNRNA